MYPSLLPRYCLFPLLSGLLVLAGCSDDKIVLDSISTIRYETFALPIDTASRDLTAICFTSPSRGIIGGTQGTLLTTTDAGTSWTNLSDPDLGDIHRLRFTSADSGWAATARGLWRTTTGGRQWTRADIWGGFDPAIHDVEFVSARRGYAVGDDGIFMTSNGGLTWNAQIRGSVDDLRAVAFSSPDTGIAVGKHFELLTTTNGGTRWDEGVTESASGYFSWYDVAYIQGGLLRVGGNLPGSDYYANGDDGCFSAREYGQEYGTDARLPYRIFRIAMAGPDRVVAVGEKSIIIRRPGFSSSEYTPWAYTFRSDGAPFDETFLDAAFADNATFYAVTEACTLYRFHY